MKDKDLEIAELKSKLNSVKIELKENYKVLLKINKIIGQWLLK